MKKVQTTQFLAQVQKNLRKQSLCTTTQSYQGICPISDLILSDKELVEGYERISNFKLDNMFMFIKREDPNQSQLVSMKISKQNSKDTEDHFIRPTNMYFKMAVLCSQEYSKYEKECTVNKQPQETNLTLYLEKRVPIDQRCKYNHNQKISTMVFCISRIIGLCAIYWAYFKDTVDQFGGADCFLQDETTQNILEYNYFYKLILKILLAINFIYLTLGFINLIWLQTHKKNYIRLQYGLSEVQLK
ncbi:transmembrane protein, putative (macronuclear) [Tetrahymena thermophila SB210]|uniref:Transmembrane protein, putative n=1 Tax=Tetrahymena thermophila (strain SB210) TaxID=312017 RepID=W7X9V7_TETTS|nr:transmembrane protein, putative [Tetrahymena thermophila SB210]EWS76200.1 transmembrane protein, putative [Tetrahymena thermophila SB210]|eukprot:XP_012651247.1 transmembrane protein, putative [Tetrahymena thermophila SB210]